MSTANFWDTEVWSFIITITLLLGAMMIANIIRRAIPALRRMLIPSPVIGGFLLLLASFVYKKITGNDLFSVKLMEMLTYHGLGLGFVAMSLRTKDKSKTVRTKYFDTGVTVVGGYVIQAVIGLIITISLSFILKDCFPAAGILLMLGYGQGPGQAYNWGRNYESVYGFVNGTSFGLTVAAMGFIAASIGGIIYLNILRKKGRFSGELGKDYVDKDSHHFKEDEIPFSESLDKLTVQVALVFIAYILAYLVMFGINAIIETGVLGNLGYNTIQPLVWGFNFLFGSIVAILVRDFLQFLRKKNVIHREYTSNFLQTRIAGFMFDIMVVASIAAIDLSAFTHPDFIVPLILVCLAGAGITYLYLKVLCPKLYPGYDDEAFLSLYGMLTGTASTGVILLREKDPNFNTPAANNLVYQQPWAIMFGAPMLLILGFAGQQRVNAIITLGVAVILFVALMLLLKIKNRKKKH